MKNLIFIVSGMNCKSCVAKIESGLKPLEMINEISVNLGSKEVSVSGEDELSMMEVKSEIEDLGFTVEKMSKN